MDDIAVHIRNAIQLIDAERFMLDKPPILCSNISTPWSLGREFLYNLMKVRPI